MPPQKCPKPKRNRADKPQPKPYLLFDAGGTLVFPDQPLLIQQAREHGIELSNEQLFSGYYQLIYSLDLQARKQDYFPRNPWPQGYAHALFETLGIVDPAAYIVAQAAEARHSQENLWTFTFDWVPETLLHLAAQGYRMSVISNSDGRTAKVFHDLGLAHYFERIFDSKILGIEKPDPAIFEWALRELNLQPSDALYIGDIFEVDVRGANRAGLGGLHLDPLGLYVGWPGVHLTTVRDLPDWLAWYAAIPIHVNLREYPQTSEVFEGDFAGKSVNNWGNFAKLASDLFPLRNLHRAAHPIPGPQRLLPALLPNSIFTALVNDILETGQFMVSSERDPKTNPLSLHYGSTAQAAV